MPGEYNATIYKTEYGYRMGGTEEERVLKAKEVRVTKNEDGKYVIIDTTGHPVAEFTTNEWLQIPDQCFKRTINEYYSGETAEQLLELHRHQQGDNQ
jgi:hypothetical protein